MNSNVHRVSKEGDTDGQIYLSPADMLDVANECGKQNNINCKSKVPFNDTTKFVSHKVDGKGHHAQSSAVFCGIQYVDYAPDTFSPSPPAKSAPRLFIRDPGPSRSFMKDHDDDCKVVDVGNVKTPENMVDKIPPPLFNKPLDVRVLGERKFDEKLRRMCNKSDGLYNTTIMSLKKSYRRATMGIDEAHVAKRDEDAACSIINERYYSRQEPEPPDADVHRFNKNSKFPVSRQEIINYMVVCSLSCSKNHYDLYCVDIGGCHGKYSSLGHSMVAGGKVASFVMNVLCRKFFLEERPITSKKHYFFSCIGVHIFIPF